MKIGDEIFYTAKGGYGERRLFVRVVGFRGTWVITEGIDDGKRRDVPRSRLEP